VTITNQKSSESWLSYAMPYWFCACPFVLILWSH